MLLPFVPPPHPLPESLYLHPTPVTARPPLQAVFLELAKPAPTIKLLYVTPEQLVKGERLRAALSALRQRGLLARVVVDEAHCVSAWGHVRAGGAPVHACMPAWWLAPWGV